MTPQPRPPAGAVDHYLQLCEDRDLEEAGRLLAPDVRIVFPGGAGYGSLPEMAAGQRDRYRWVRKRREQYIEGRTPDGRTAVTSLGTLYGEGLDGRPFEGVRYVDVFVLRDGLIAEQHVFNDLGDTGTGVPVRGPQSPSSEQQRC